MTKPNLNAFYSPVLQTTRVSEKHEKKHKPQHPQGSNYSKPIFIISNNINHKTKLNIYNATGYFNFYSV